MPRIEQRVFYRHTAIVKPHATGAYSYQQIGEHFGLRFTAEGKVVWRDW
jgi:hypothetical protein